MAQPFDALAWYQCDHLGTPRELTDQNGDIAWSAQYKAWGEIREQGWASAQQHGLTNPIRFQGQYHDHETGLHYNQNRYYDPNVGRFVSKDPISYAGGLNLFAYAPNPLGWIDPLGLARCPSLEGGSFRDMDAKRKENEVGHHMPQNTYNRTIGVSRNDGPAVLMTTDAHAEARTLGKRQGVNA